MFCMILHRKILLCALCHSRKNCQDGAASPGIKGAGLRHNPYIMIQRERVSNCRSLLNLCKLLILRGSVNAKNARVDDSLHVYCTQGKWRRARDSNPRYPFRYAGFQDRSHQPLGQLSAGRGAISIVRRKGIFPAGFGDAGPAKQQKREPERLPVLLMAMSCYFLPCNSSARASAP